jgi:hypothetical protein
MPGTRSNLEEPRSLLFYEPLVNTFRVGLSKGPRPVFFHECHSAVQANMSNGSAIQREGTVTIRVGLIAIFQTNVYTTRTENQANNKKETGVL